MKPRSDQPHYGEHLGDAAYWDPWVREVLDRHDLPAVEIEEPFVGTFPTFLVGDVVVKLFGEGFDGVASHGAELAMHELLASHRDIPAPGLVASGWLYDDEPRWPYLVTERIAGVAVREGGASIEVASRLGEVVALLHALPAPAVVDDRDLVASLRATAGERLRSFGLPERLVEQVPAFLADALPEDTLVHADITADHVFVDGTRLVGIIDWGDAIVADPHYELVPVFFDALAGERALLDSFLDGYGWSRGDDDFARCSLQAVLEFQFDVVGIIRRMIDLDEVRSLDELASRLFEAR